MVLKKKIKMFNLLYIGCYSSVLFVWVWNSTHCVAVWPCLALNLQSSCLSLLSQHSGVNWQESLHMAPFNVFFF